MFAPQWTSLSLIYLSIRHFFNQSKLTIDQSFEAARAAANMAGIKIAATKPVSATAEPLWLVPLTMMVAGLYAASEVVAVMQGASTAMLVGDYAGKALRAAPLVIAVIVLVQLIHMIRAGESRPTAKLVHMLRAEIADRGELLAKLAPFILMPVLFASVGMFKMQIPNIAPFAHDTLFAEMDAALFGRQPWELTHAWFGGAMATMIIDRLYTLWVFLLSAAIMVFALAVPPAERARFFLSFTAIWIVLGVIGAYLGTSAGPCYVEPLGLPIASEFTGLMQRLEAIDAELATSGSGGLGAFGWQEMLWNVYTNRTISFSAGISAMPSLHNAIAILYVFAAFRLGRLAGFGALLFALVTFVGSVHLGWHYAVDGLFAFAAVLPIWWLVGFYLKRSGYDAAVAR